MAEDRRPRTQIRSAIGPRPTGWDGVRGFGDQGRVSNAKYRENDGPSFVRANITPR